MNKQEFISRLSEELDVAKSEIANVISKMVDVISEVLSKEDEIALPGFGKFLVVHRAGRKGINPLTKKTLEIPNKAIPVFKASSTLKSLVFDKVKYKAPNNKKK